MPEEVAPAAAAAVHQIEAPTPASVTSAIERAGVAPFATAQSWTPVDVAPPVAEPPQHVAAVGPQVALARAPSAEHTRPAPFDLEALAGDLYEHVRTRLTTELLLDRERSCLPIDGS